MDATDYNYVDFDLEREDPPFHEFRKRLHVTERAPSARLEDLESGQTVPLSRLWAKGLAVLEFGSFT